MSKERLQKVIDIFGDSALIYFFREYGKFAEAKESLPQFNSDKFTGFQRLGAIEFDDRKKLVVATAYSVNDLTERSSKKAQYDIAKKILKEFNIYDGGILIYYDREQRFRFSLVYTESADIKVKFSNFRRFTYFVSRDQTNKTFLDRVGSCDFSSLGVIKDAFSVEKVTKDFYKQIADWYFWAVKNSKFPDAAESEENGRNVAVIRLITRLIFIWFMKERKLVSPGLFDKNKISSLLTSLKADETTYYKAILQNLFFATLNTKIEDRTFRFTGSFQGKNTDYMDHGIYRYEDYFNNQEDMLAVFKDIPFLNGGLFDCLDWSAKESGTGKEARFDGFSDKEVSLKVPNYLFFSDEREADLNKDYGTKNKKYRVQGLLNILSAYNFTIDENDPNDQEVALDPELLGKVFENLLASFNPETATTARKATGSYNTPREIVDYMVTQSLKQYYKTHLGDVADIDNKLDELLSPITEEPVNPFGETDSKRIVRLTEELRIVDPAVGSGAFPMGILNKLVAVLARVDHNNRLWQEAQLKAVEAVTDPLLKQKLIKQINEQFAEKNSNYGRKLYLIQRCIYGVDIQQIAVEIAKLRFFIALLVDERIDKSKPNWGIEPLPNLDFKLMQGNSLISEFMGINLDAEDSDAPAKLMKDETDELISRYQDKKSEYQYEPDRKKKEALKSEIEKLIEQIFESKLKNQKAEYYSKLKNIELKYTTVPDIEQRNEAIKKDTETLNRNYKFDLTQAEIQLKEFTTGLKVKPFFAWKLYFAEVFHEKGGFDIVIANPPYILLQNLSLDKNTYDSMISSFYSAQYKVDTYHLFIERSINLLTVQGILAFITPNTFLKNKHTNRLRELILTRTQLHDIVLFYIKVFADPSVDNLVFMCQKFLPDPRQSNLVRIHKIKSHNFEEEIKQFKTFPQDNIKAPAYNFMIDTSEEDTSFLNRLESDCKKLGEIAGTYFGIQTFNRKKYVISTAKSSQYRKVIDGGNVFRYFLTPSKEYIDYRSQNIKSGGDERIYRKERIVVRQIGKYPEGTLCPPGLLTLNTIYNIYLKSDEYDIRYILALVNSKVVNFYWLKRFYDHKETFPKIKKQPLESIPIRVIQKDDQKPIIGLVNQIISTKKNDQNADVSDLESQIDQLVYKLYGLTPEEKAVIEDSYK